MPSDDDLLTRLAQGPEDEAADAPARLKARLYSALVAEQQQTGPLRSMTETKSAGYGLCFFEELVRITPVPEPVKQPFICWHCHARVLAERMEHAPIWWPNCPYSEFQKG